MVRLFFAVLSFFVFFCCFLVVLVCVGYSYFWHFLINYWLINTLELLGPKGAQSPDPSQTPGALLRAPGDGPAPLGHEP